MVSRLQREAFAANSAPGLNHADFHRSAWRSSAVVGRYPRAGVPPEVLNGMRVVTLAACQFLPASNAKSLALAAAERIVGITPSPDSRSSAHTSRRSNCRRYAASGMAVTCGRLSGTLGNADISQRTRRQSHHRPQCTCLNLGKRVCRVLATVFGAHANEPAI